MLRKILLFISNGAADHHKKTTPQNKVSYKLFEYGFDQIKCDEKK